jgi:hypothetical protein
MQQDKHQAPAKGATSTNTMLRFPDLWIRLLKMQYRGKYYVVAQGIEPSSWKWTVDLDERTSKSGETKTRGLASAQSFYWSIGC